MRSRATLLLCILQHCCKQALSLRPMRRARVNIRMASVERDADTSKWEFYANRPAARGAVLGAGACRVFAAEFRARRLARRARAEDARAVRRRAAERCAALLITLGPTYVKLGQIASCRRELQGTEWAAGLARLQDRVPGFEGGGAEIARQLGPRYERHFAAVDAEPVAAASLGQVHLGTLKNGTRVAVKIQRPSLRRIYDKDVTLLRKLFKLADKLRVKAGVDQDWLAIFDDAAGLLYREIDYRVEALHARTFAANFEDTEWVTTPEVFPELSGETVLTMAYLPGVSLRELDAIDADPALDARRLATRLAQCYFLQFCKHGFFNTDPHAGNLAADAAFQPGGRLIVYDFGQAARLDADERAGALMLTEAIIGEDPEMCVDAFELMGVVRAGYDRAAVVATIADNFRTGKVKTRAAAPKDAAAAAESPAEPPPDQTVIADFQLPATLAFVSRAMSQMQGVGERLDPDFEFIAASAPMIPEVKGVEAYVADELKKQVSKMFKF